MARIHRTKAINEKLFFLFSVFLLTEQILAAPISRQTAKNVGLNWMWKHRVMWTAPEQRPQILAKGRISKIIEQLELKREEIVVGHLIRTDPKGFVLVAPDDSMKPILAYSLENGFPANNLPHALQDWIEELKAYIDYIDSHPNLRRSPKLSTRWEKLNKDITDFDNSISYEIDLNASVSGGVDPLLNTTWGQGYPGYPYNKYCPGQLEIEENFEGKDSEYLDQFPRSTGVDADWEVVTINLVDQVAKSGSISHNQRTWLCIKITIVEAGNIRFKRKVSSEINWDQLKFCVDDIDNVVDFWYGEVDWDWSSDYYLEEGDHDLFWVYEKNGDGNSGDDCAWIDEIHFPRLRTKAGCVAVAIGQIMKFHNYPPRGNGSHCSDWPSGDFCPCADFGNTRYDWHNMPNLLSSANSEEEIDAVSTLLYHCGVAVEMDYGYEGSSAFSSDVPVALETYFHYNTGVLLDKDDYSSEGWLSIMKQEVDANRPVYYRFKNALIDGDGHAVVLDGYDNSDFVHFNFGWHGSADGFYQIYPTVDIDPFPPNGDEWNWRHGAITNIAPKYPPNPDLNNNGLVNFQDFAILGRHWLDKDCNDPDWCEGADLNWDGKVDFEDVNILTDHWLEGLMPSDSLIWVYINDPGVSGHEGFTGYMSKYETTNAQYCQFLNTALASGDITVGADNIVYGANGSNGGEDFVGEIYFETYAADSDSQITYSGGTFSVRSRDGRSMANHPVVMVSWYGATAFCNYYGYRLPTEWEWQAVADYDGSYTYGCGTTINCSMANYYLVGVENFCNPLNLSSHPYTTPVDYYSSYGYGMNDMAGNVWEWTRTVSGSDRVIRGGSWSATGPHSTVSYRDAFTPRYTWDDLGFRVCRDHCGMEWVHIDDPGVSGHEGFTGEMSKYETTNAQYCQFLNAALASGDITVGADNIVYGANGSNSGTDFVGEIYFETYAADSDSQITYSGGTFSVRSRDGRSMANHPVVMVSWYGATAFCNYYGYRLPTEWEWQAVADYDGSYTYGCGTTINQSKANYYLGGENFCNPLNLSSYPYTSPVDHYSSYGYGMNDMAGNVWEWTSTVSGSDRVIRGGSWSGSGPHCTVSYGDGFTPRNTFYDEGFRVCR